MVISSFQNSITSWLTTVPLENQAFSYIPKMFTVFAESCSAVNSTIKNIGVLGDEPV